MAITATNLGRANSGGSSVTSLSTASLDVAPTAGQLTVVVWTAFSSPTAFTCADDVAGTTGWTVVPRYVSAGAGAGYMWMAWNPSLSAGVTQFTITVTAGSAVPLVMGIAQFAGAAASPRDATGDDAGSSSSTTALNGSTTSGSLAQADELLVGFMSDGSGSAPLSFVPGAGWNALTQVPESGGNFGIRWAWFENTVGTSPVAWSPSWTPTAPWALKIYAFKAAAAAAAINNGLLMLGAG